MGPMRTLLQRANSRSALQSIALFLCLRRCLNNHVTSSVAEQMPYFYAFLRNLMLSTLLLCLSIGCSDPSTSNLLDTNDKSTTSHADSVFDHNAEWDTFSNAFMQSLFEISPTTAVWSGKHEYDGQLPDFSRAGLRNTLSVLHRLQEQAAAFDSDSLTRDRRFEQELIHWYVDRRLFWLESADWPHKNPSFYRGSLAPTVYVTREYAPLEARLASLTEYAIHIPEALSQVQENLELPLPETYRKLGIGYFEGMAKYLEEDVQDIFKGVGSAELQQRFKHANTDATAAFRNLARWLEASEPAAPGSYALGAKRFQEMLLRGEMVDLSLEQLSDLGQKDLERNLAALADACERITPEGVDACIRIVASHKPKGGPVARGRAQLAELKQFVMQEELVSIPGDEIALVREAPPYRRSNLAYISIPGPFEKKSLPSIYYISPPDPSWSSEVQAAFVPSEARLMFVSLHEVWPGHFLWGLHRKLALRPLSRMLSSTTFSEGWAHYAEEMMWEAGFHAGDPEMHVGQLVSALMRNVRYMSSLGLHTSGMSVEDSIKLFHNAAYLDTGNARQQAARGTYDPNYLAYTLGKLMIRDLRDDWTTSRGGRSAWKAFHDELLSYGGAPLPLVRKYMLAE